MFFLLLTFKNCGENSFSNVDTTFANRATICRISKKLSESISFQIYGKTELIQLLAGLYGARRSKKPVTDGPLIEDKGGLC